MPRDPSEFGGESPPDAIKTQAELDAMSPEDLAAYRLLHTDTSKQVGGAERDAGGGGGGGE